MNPSSSQPLAKLLIVDDEVAQMTAMCHTLEDTGYATTGFASAHAALAALREQEFDLVLTDLMMPDMDGIALIKAGQEIDRDLVAVVMTGHGAVETAVQAMQAGALDYIQKPFKLRDILPVITRALTVRRLRTENIQLRQAVAIHELSTAFTDELNPASVANKVAEAAFEQTANGAVSVLIVAEDGQALQVAAARGPNAQQIAGMSIPCDDAIRAWVAQLRPKLLNSSAWAPADFYLNYGPDAFDYATCVPMLAGGDFVGILNFTCGPPARTVTRGQLKMLNTLAGTAAAAMQVASLLDRLHRTNDELEQRVQERTAQLEAANNELEAFSYSVSHDLRAPLRAIMGYSEILLQECRPTLSADAQRQFDTISAAAHRMGELIEDLLELAHLSRQTLLKVQIQPARLVKQVLGELRSAHPDREVAIKMAELPECMADESLLRQVYVNLLSNAFKFTGQRNPAVVEIGTLEQPDETVYFVRDNGAGFDMQHVARLFGVFQRLHGASEFAGTGIGLSIVQRIVNRHGGRVWAEGAVGEGATFYFTLPNAS